MKKKTHVRLRNSVLFLFPLLAFQFPAAAQSPEEAQKEINAIKKDSNYLWAMGTSTTSADEASYTSRELLGQEVKEWLADKNFEEEKIAGCVVKSKECSSEIPTQRAKIYRSFTYVRKSDVLTFTGSDDLLLIEILEGSLRKATQTEERRMAEAVETVSSQIQEKEDESEKSLVPVIQSATTQPEGTASEATSWTETQKKFQSVDNLQLSMEEKRMLYMTSFDEVNTYVTKKKNAGKLASFGKNGTIPSGKNYHACVFDTKSGNVVCWLRAEPTRLINLTTKSTDDIRGYEHYGIIWFVLKY